MASNVLPLFWHLSSTDRKTRLEASESLVSSLEKFQDQFVSGSAKQQIGKNKAVDAHEDAAMESGEEVEDDDEEDDEDMDSDESGVEVDDSDDDERSGGRRGQDLSDEDKRIAALDRVFEKENSEDVRYSFKRLVRGLASSRESSRLGFAVALTELLARVPTFSPTHVISLILRSTQTNKTLKGTEQRDLLFARLFGLMSVIDSGLLAQSSTTLEDFKTTLGELWTLGEKKSWLRESAWWATIRGLKELINRQADEAPEWREEAIKAVVMRVFGNEGKGALAWTQEKVALALMLQSHRPDLEWKSLLSPTFRNGNLLAQSNLTTLSKMLKETSESNDAAAASGDAVPTNVQTGNWKPQLHFIWDILFDVYFPESASTAAGDHDLLGKSLPTADRASFQDFWQVVVDEGLFNPTSTPQRKFWGFEVVAKAIKFAGGDDLPVVFTKNFMKTWMNQLSGQDKYLHKAAVQVAKALQSVTKEQPFVGFTLLSQLLGQNGSQNFDKLTRTKTVEGIMSGLDAAGVEKYLDYVMKTFTEAHDSESGTAENQQIWAIDQLAALLRNPTVPKTDKTTWTILQHLLLYGFFTVRKANSKSPCQALHSALTSAIVDKVTEVCRARFFSCLIDLTISQRARESDKGKQSLAADESGKLWLSKALETMTALEADKKHVTPIIDVDEEIEQARKEANETLKTLKKSATLQQDVEQGLRILLTFALLKTYDDDVKAYEILDDVHKCAQRLAKPSASSSSKAAEDLPPIDLLVDALIAYLDQASSDLKALAGHVFGLISSQASESTVEHLIAQLEQIGGGDQSDDEDEESDDDVMGENDDEEEGEDEDEEEDEEMVEEEDEDEATAGVDPEFRKRVAEALQVSGMADAEGEDEAESGSDNESDTDSIAMDDDQMLALDDKLAAIFKSQTSAGKQGNKASIVENMHFKSRVLDLIEIYLRKQQANPLGFSFITPLIRLAQMSGGQEKSVATKAANLLLRRFEKSEVVPVETSVESVAEILEEIHDLARKGQSKDIAKLCSQCSIAVAKSLAHAEHGDVVTKAYRKSLEDYMTRKSSRLPPSFINDFIARQPLQAWPLRDELIRYAQGEAVNSFHQEQAFAMLAALAKHLSSLSQNVDAAEIKKFVADCQQTIYNSLEKVAAGEVSWGASRVKEVIRVALQIARHSTTVFKSSDDLAEAWNVSRLRELQQKLAETATLKSNPSVFTLLAQFSLLVDPEAKKAQVAKKQEKQDAKKRKREEGSAEGSSKTAVPAVAAKPTKKAKVAGEKKSEKKVVKKSKA